MNWFNSFLSNRIKKSDADQLSAPLSIKGSQGLVLSATLLLVVINVLLLLTFNGTASVFADEISYFYSGKSVHNITKRVNMKFWFGVEK